MSVNLDERMELDMKFSRRTLLNNATAASLLSILPLSACRQATDETSITTKTSDDSVMKLLESATDFMLNAYPESASSAVLIRINMQG